MKNWDIIFKDNGISYIRIKFDDGKVLLTRRYLGSVLEKDGLIEIYKPVFELLNNEQVIEEDTGDIYVINKKTGELVRD